MSSFDDMINELKHNTEVPASVWSKYSQTLSHLPDITDKNTKTKHWRLKCTAAAMAVLIIGGSVFYVNPALAKKIPF